MRHLEYKWLVGITFVLGLVMQILDVTVLNVALATLGREFDVGAGVLQWVLTGYMVSLAVFIPASGWIADRFGSKRAFLSAVVIFTFASVLCGLAPNVWALIGARVLQGVGGGMLVPVGQAMLFRAFPPHERAKASAVLAIPITVAPMLGPLIGGVLVQFASWRWIFFINVPVGALALTFTVLFLREERQERPGAFDVPGFVLAGAGLAMLLVGLEQSAGSGWSSPASWAPLAASALLIGALAWRELSVRQPMLDLRLLRDRMFGTGNALLMCMTGAMFSVLFLTPLYVQNVRDGSPTLAGMVLMPQAVSMLLVTQVVSRVYGRIGPRRLILAGFGVQFLVGLGLQTLTETTPFWWLIACLTVQGVAMALLMTPVQTATFARIASASMGRASSLFNSGRQVAMALGTAIVATVLVAATNLALTGVDPTQPELAAQAQMAGFRGAYLVTLGFSALGFLVAFRLRDSDAAPTLDPTHRSVEPEQTGRVG